MCAGARLLAKVLQRQMRSNRELMQYDFLGFAAVCIGLAPIFSTPLPHFWPKFAGPMGEPCSSCPQHNRRIDRINPTDAALAPMQQWFVTRQKCVETS
jgi:hypothetical protein